MAERVSRWAVLSVFLYGIGAAWNGGNVGPVVTELASEFNKSQWVLPADPIAPNALMTLVNNAIPIVAIPLAGSAIDGGDGDAVFLVLAAVVTLGALVNLSPPRRQIGPAVAGAD